MKKIKRKIALLLAFVMVLAVLPVNVQNVEAARMDPRQSAVLPTNAAGQAVSMETGEGWFVDFDDTVLLRNIFLDYQTYSPANVTHAAIAVATINADWLNAGHADNAAPATGRGRAGSQIGAGLAVPGTPSTTVSNRWALEIADAFNILGELEDLGADDFLGGWFNIGVPALQNGTILWNATAPGLDGSPIMAAWLFAPQAINNPDGTPVAPITGRWTGGNAILVVITLPTAMAVNPSIAWPIAFRRPAATAGNNQAGNVNVNLFNLQGLPTAATVTHTMYVPQTGGVFNFPNPGTANDVFSTFIDIGALNLQEQQLGSFDTPWWRIELNLDRGFSFAQDTMAPAINVENRAHGTAPTSNIILNSWRPNTGAGFGLPGTPVMPGVSPGMVNPVGNTVPGILQSAAGTTFLPGGWQMTDIARDLNRRITMDVTITNPIEVVNNLTRVATNRITDGITIGNLRIVADDTARPTADGVNIEVVLTRFTQTAGTNTLALGVGQNNIFRGTFTVAQYNHVGIILELDEDQDPEDFQLTSGMREWSWDGGASVPGTGTRNPTDFPLGWDAVIGDSVDPYFHQTARVVLTETVPGVLPFTGLTEVLFSFGEGVQVLGVELETNNANFFRPVEGGTGAIAWNETWFATGNANVRSGDLNVLVRPDYVSIRPHIENHLGAIAEIYATFYLSIQPGFAHLHGQDVVATASFRGGGINLSDDFAASAVVAVVYDPITVSVQETVIQDDGATAWGQIRTESIGNITITETEPGALRRNRQLWIGVEGGVSLGWGQADLISVRATGATTDGSSGLSVGPIVVDQRGFWVTINGESVTDVGSITFTGVEISGALVAGNDWGIIVAGDAVADNFGVSAFTWDGPIFGGGTFTRIGHGLFTPEPYLTAAFSFDGTDLFAPAPGVTAPGPAPAPGPGTGGAGGAIPVVLSQNLPYFIQHGPQQGQAIAPSFEMRAFGAGQNASAFVSVGAIADILGWTAAWDQGTQTATLTTNDGRTIVFVNGQATATVNGQTMQITNADGTPSPTYINNDRLMLSLLFFQQNLGVSIIWMGGTPGAFQIMIVP